MVLRVVCMGLMQLGVSCRYLQKRARGPFTREPLLDMELMVPPYQMRVFMAAHRVIKKLDIL